MRSSGKGPSKQWPLRVPRASSSPVSQPASRCQGQRHRAVSCSQTRTDLQRSWANVWPLRPLVPTAGEERKPAGSWVLPEHTVPLKTETRHHHLPPGGKRKRRNRPGKRGGGPHRTAPLQSRRRRRKAPRNISDTGLSPRKGDTVPAALKAKDGKRRGTKNNLEAGSLTDIDITDAPQGPRAQNCAPPAARAGTEVGLLRKGGNPAEHIPDAAPRTTARSAQRPGPATCPASPSRGSASCQPGV